MANKQALLDQYGYVIACGEYDTRQDGWVDLDAGAPLVIAGRYKVVDGHFVDTGKSLVPPFLGATWDPAVGDWVDARTAEEKWAAVRAERDKRIAASDWVVLRAADQGAPVPPEWLAYRQALRDVTAQPDPCSINWPEPPLSA